MAFNAGHQVTRQLGSCYSDTMDTRQRRQGVFERMSECQCGHKTTVFTMDHGSGGSWPSRLVCLFVCVSPVFTSCACKYQRIPGQFSR